MRSVSIALVTFSMYCRYDTHLIQQFVARPDFIGFDEYVFDYGRKFSETTSSFHIFWITIGGHLLT